MAVTHQSVRHRLRPSVRAIPFVTALTVVGTLVLVHGQAPAGQQASVGPGPGQRVLLDAHNAYPYEGRFSDRIDRGLATGLPVAIEQDLIWRLDSSGHGVSVVGHDVEHAGGAPSFETYFFERLAPIMSKALEDNARETWPVIVLNLDFKTNEAAHHDAVWATLHKYEAWLTTAPRTNTPDKAEPLVYGPLMVLTGTSAAQAARFHDTVPLGERLYLFGAIDVPTPSGADAKARAIALAASSPDTLIAAAAGNYHRWVNFPWGVVEAGGPTQAGDWTDADDRRLRALVARAHAQRLWIRFYTLNGHAPDDSQGWFAGYNFGSVDAARLRWRAARAAGVDFIATDQYEEFSRNRRP